MPPVIRLSGRRRPFLMIHARKEQGQLQRIPYALFDYDGTLAPGDSIIPYLFYAVRRGKAPFRQLFIAGAAGLMPILLPGRFTHTWAKTRALSFLKGHTRQEMDAFAQEFFRSRVKKKLYPEGKAELARLKAEGFRILLVSASPDVYLSAFGRELGVDGVLATPCGLEEDGETYSGMVGENCKGVEKPLRIASYLAANHHELDWEASRAYGDSASDVPMLTLTAHPVCVNPKKALRKSLPQTETVAWGK